MIIFDEKKHAEKMMNSGFSTKSKRVYELYILCKYFYHLGNEPDEVKKKLIKFCNKYIEDFNNDEWYRVINRAINSGQKGVLKTGKSVSITEKEINHIRQLETLNQQKVAFVLLVFYKFFNYKKFKVTIEDIFDLAKLSISGNHKLSILHVLNQKEYIDIDMRGRRWVKFAQKRGKVAFTITDFDDFVYEFLRFVGEGRFKDCESCGKTIVFYNTRKYCKKCSERIKKENNKIADIKYKKARKMETR